MYRSHYLVLKARIHSNYPSRSSECPSFCASPGTTLPIKSKHDCLIRSRSGTFVANPMLLSIFTGRIRVVQIKVLVVEPWMIAPLPTTSVRVLVKKGRSTKIGRLHRNSWHTIFVRTATQQSRSPRRPFKSHYRLKARPRFGMAQRQLNVGSYYKAEHVQRAVRCDQFSEFASP